MGSQLYGYTSREHEYCATVPPIQAGDRRLEICVSAHGGGTVGESYAGNGWDYAVYDDGALILEGSDLRSGGIGATHAQTARTLATFLAAAGEHFHLNHYRTCIESPYPGNVCDYAPEYGKSQGEWLADSYERLDAYAND